MKTSTAIRPLTVTIPGVREMTGLGTTKIYELIGEGKLATVKIGRRTLVRTDSIEALVQVAS